MKKTLSLSNKNPLLAEVLSLGYRVTKRFTFQMVWGNNWIEATILDLREIDSPDCVPSFCFLQVASMPTGGIILRQSYSQAVADAYDVIQKTQEDEDL